MSDFAWPIVNMGILALIILIGILVLWKTPKDKRSGFPLVDERTQKLNGKAAYYAMFMYQYFIIAYLLVNIVEEYCSACQKSEQATHDSSTSSI